MRVLVACEYSGIVREEFKKRGHYAVSCDLEPTEIPGNHHQCDVLEIIDQGWDLMIAFPPCTHLSSSGARWWKKKKKEQRAAIKFVKTLMNARIGKIAIENPVGILSTKIRKPDQIVQPYFFGDSAKKTTCLWLKNLPLLKADNEVDPGEFVTTSSGKTFSKWEYDISCDKENRAKLRSKTFPGFARAMAEQWG